MTNAKHLTEGDVVVLNGRDWTVVSNRPVDGGYYLSVASEAAGMPFGKVVEAEREFEVKRPPLYDEAGAQTRWAGADEVEAAGGIELWREEAGVYTVAPVDETTVAAHLLTFHHLTFGGVSLTEARALVPDAERTMTPEEALKRADFEGMLRLHDAQHAPGMEPAVPHRHKELK